MKKVTNIKMINSSKLAAILTSLSLTFGLGACTSVDKGENNVVQTTEDKKLINEYTDRLGIPYSINQTTIQFLSNIQTLQNYDSLSR